jgi:DNA gyrase inhibitor GyrI
MNLTEEPETVTLPETHYVFIERTGPFMITAPQAWEEVHRLVPAVLQHNQITGYMSLYRMGPNVYRAGVAISAPPVKLPQGLQYEKFRGGRYGRFVLTGPYLNLPKASGRVFEIVAEKKIELRDGFFIENYVNNPRDTTEEELITEIMVPLVA